MIRVAVVTDGLYPYFKGGKEVRYFELLRRLVRPGVEVDVYTMRWWGDAKEHTAEGMRHRGLCRPWPMYVGERRSISQAVFFAAACLRLVGAKVDLIDADHMPYLQIVPLRLVAWVLGVPLVITWHEWWGREYWRSYLGRLGLLASLIERFVARLGDHIIVMNDQTAERLAEAGVPPGRISVMHLGVDLEAIASAGADGPRYDVVFVGRLLKHKNVDLLVDALAMLESEGMPLTLAVAGEGPEEQRLRALVSDRHLDASVTFLGRLEGHDEVFNLMKRAAIFAYPSVREGWGLAAAEALACGTPVLTAEHPDNHARLLVEHGVNGLRCLPDVPAVASALRSAVEHPLDRVAVASSVSSMAWPALADNLLDLYCSRVGR